MGRRVPPAGSPGLGWHADAGLRGAAPLARLPGPGNNLREEDFAEKYGPDFRRRAKNRVLKNVSLDESSAGNTMFLALALNDWAIQAKPPCFTARPSRPG
jgi:hypothetical protein